MLFTEREYQVRKLNTKGEVMQFQALQAWKEILKQTNNTAQKVMKV